MIRWQWARFNELTGAQVYEVLALRERVFVVEQNCVYLDADGLDYKAWHLLGWADLASGPVLALYLRVFSPGDYFEEHAIGRVITDPAYRGQGLGRALMVKAIHHIHAMQTTPQASVTVPVRISAQAYLEDFYASLGFERKGEGYLEDGIPHVSMLLPAKTSASPASSKYP